ncbi:MAG TPA: BamA/TamA family outer membrane protein [Bryobacteraceae bacterium]|nr:BamA/TamA family outer membrane protein [Bryobacteraceae bacterium]
MKLALVLVAAAILLQPATRADTVTDAERATDLNVNSRYTIESIGFMDQSQYRLSPSAMEEMRLLIGAKLNSEALNRLVQHVRSELRAHDVTFKLVRGGEPGSVKVLLEVDPGPGRIDVSIPQFGYYTGQGWTAAAEATATLGANTLTFRALKDNDSSIEQMAGIQTSYARHLADDRIRLGFEFDAYADQYDPATLAALASAKPSSLGAGAYSSRLNFEPSASFVLAKPLTFTIGVSFEQLQPGFSAAPLESANAVINTLRYHQLWSSDATTQQLDAGYSLHAATTLLGTDLAYTRHTFDVDYLYKHAQQLLEVSVLAGVIYGRAPLFERFVLGDSTDLRGWDKYELDPLGGNRLAYGSVTYGYHILRVFYDAGSVWDQGNAPEARQSAGIGVASGLGLLDRGAFLLAVAFPLRQGHTEPVLIAGMNF